jgi:hypothetical protein
MTCVEFCRVRWQAGDPGEPMVHFQCVSGGLKIRTVDDVSFSLKDHRLEIQKELMCEFKPKGRKRPLVPV